MTISTYSDLQNQIKSFLHRASVLDAVSSDNIPTLINLAEARINREVKSRDQEVRATSTLSSTSAYVTLPTDLVRIRSVWLTSGGINRPLEYMTPDALMMSYPTASASGEPKHYTIVGQEMRFGQVPDSSYDIEIWYYKRFDPLSTAVNSLFTNSPDLYIYATLAACSLYLKDDKRVMQWEATYQSVKNSINDSEEDGRRGVAMRMIAA